MNRALDQLQPSEVADEPIVFLELGDAAELTLGSGGAGGEDKRYEYN